MEIRAVKEQIHKPIFTRNRKVAKNVEDMHNRWEANQFPSRVQKKEKDPNSIGGRKEAATELGVRLTRSQVRLLLKEKQLVVSDRQ